MGSGVVSGLCNSRWVGPVGEAASWYSWAGPIGEARMIMEILVGPGRGRWVKVLDLEL